MRGPERPGYELVTQIEAGIPVSWVTLDLLVQEKKALPLVEEFVLRLADLGVRDADDMSAALGIPTVVTHSAIANQLSLDNVDFAVAASGRRAVTLTSSGAQAVVEHSAITPKQIQDPWCFDRMVWAPTRVPKAALVSRAQAKDMGLLLLTGAQKQNRQVTTEDMDARTLNRILHFTGEAQDAAVEILAVTGLVKQPRLFMPATLLVYRSLRGEEVLVNLLVDDQLSRPHDLALEHHGGAAALGIVVEPVERPHLEPELEKQRMAKAEVVELRRQSQTARREEPLAAIDGSSGSVIEEDQPSAAEVALEEAVVRSVPVFEHRELLQRALTETRQRLLIIAPWVKSSVVTTEFLSTLERLLKRGVRVTIAHGYGEDDSGSHTHALDRLGNLSKRYEQMDVVRLRNTHAKILIWDRRWVTTSFNWLSFLGDPDRTYRMEEGTLVSLAEVVDRQYDYYIERIEVDRR